MRLKLVNSFHHIQPGKRIPIFENSINNAGQPPFILAVWGPDYRVSKCPKYAGHYPSRAAVRFSQSPRLVNPYYYIFTISYLEVQ